MKWTMQPLKVIKTEGRGGKPENKATHITSIPRFWLLQSMSVMLDTLSKAVQSILPTIVMCLPMHEANAT